MAPVSLHTLDVGSGRINSLFRVNDTKIRSNPFLLGGPCFASSGQQLPRSTERASPGSVPSTAAVGSERRRTGPVRKRRFGRHVKHTVRKYQLCLIVVDPAVLFIKLLLLIRIGVRRFSTRYRCSFS